MVEPAYTVTSDSETTGEEKSSTFPEIAIGIDIGTSQCSVAVWNGSQVELLKNTRNQKIMKSYVTFKDNIPSGGVSSQLSHEDEMLSGATIFNMKRLIGRVDTDPVVHACKNLPFLVQTLDIGVRPFIAALVNNMWRSTTPEETLWGGSVGERGTKEGFLIHGHTLMNLTTWFQIRALCCLKGGDSATMTVGLSEREGLLGSAPMTG